MDVSQAAAVYAEQLLPLGHGFPQWFPDHATGQAEVRIGDIGYFRDGLFHRVCNATLPADHPANECGVPEGFDPLTYDSANLLRTNDAYLPDGSLASRTMKHVNKSSGMDLSIPDIQPGPQSALAYECFSNKGGLLVLKGGGATQDIVLPNTIFPEYMLAHYDSWYKLARDRGHSIGPEDLIMVNGTVKAADWTVSSYSDKGKHHSFNFDLPGPIHAMAGFSSTKRDMSEQKRSRLGNMAKSGDETGTLAKDQCVFVSRYVIRHRYQSRSTRLGGTSSLRAGKKTSQANGVSSGGKPDNHVKRTTRKGASRSQIWDPVEVLLGYILKNSECDAAIASDDDIKRLLQAGYQIEPDHFKKRLHATKPRIQVSNTGLGMIAHSDNEAHPASTSTDGHEQSRKKSRFSSMFPLTSYVRKAISDEDFRNLRSSISAVARAVMGGLERATRPKPTHWDYQSPLEMDNSLWEELVGPAHTRSVQQVLDDARADAPPLSFT